MHGVYEYRHSAVKLTGLKPGMVDLGSSGFKVCGPEGLIDVKSLQKRYLTLLDAFRKGPSVASLYDIIDFIDTAVQVCGHKASIYKLGSAFEDHIDLFDDIMQSFNASYMTERNDSKTRIEEARILDPLFATEKGVVYVLGGATSYYTDNWTRVIQPGGEEADAIVTAAINRSELESLPKTVAMACQGLLADALSDKMFQILEEYIGSPVQNCICYKSAGGSNPGFGVITNAGRSYEIKLDKLQVSKFSEKLQRTISKMIEKGPLYDQIEATYAGAHCLLQEAICKAKEQGDLYRNIHKIHADSHRAVEEAIAEIIEKGKDTLHREILDICRNETQIFLGNVSDDTLTPVEEVSAPFMSPSRVSIFAIAAPAVVICVGTAYALAACYEEGGCSTNHKI